MIPECWVNVYHGLYGNHYYVSLGYGSQEQAIKALDSPKAKNIRKRYIKTTQIEIVPKIIKHENTKASYRWEKMEGMG